VFAALLALSPIIGFAGTPEALAADTFPAKEISFICPWPPGGSSDLLVRAIAQSANKILPKPLVVVNQDGANGIVATTRAAKATADGYTLVQGASGLFLTQPYVQKSLGYKQDDFDFLIGFTNEPILLSVHSSSPYATLEKLLDGAKKDDKVISYGNSGMGGFPQLALAHLFQLAGVKSQPVPFKGSAPAVTAILGGHVDALASHPGEALPHIKAGTLRPLAVSSPTRFPDLPNVPTMKEKGFNIDMGVRKFIFAPKGLPKEIRATLVEVLQKVLKDPSFLKSMADINLMVDPMTGKQVLEYLNTQGPIMKKLLEEMPKRQ
jgi:tripartite-type tricarboxylate transporter receptor subunit TctC